MSPNRPALKHPLFGEAISTYSRAQAIADGVLVEVDAKLTNEAGFRFPIAITRSLAEFLTPKQQAKRMGQSVEGRLWDVLTMLRLAIQKRGLSDDRVSFRVIVSRKLLSLYAAIGGGDNGEPVITVMQPGEN